VCAGGWTLEAAEALCPGDAAAGDALVGLHALIDKHLVQRTDGTREPRFTMLEMIREFALERLAARGAVSAAQRAHAAHALRFAERAASYLHGPEQAAWFDRLDDEVANLRVALTWLLESGEGQDARRLAWALHWFWHVRGYLTEGRDWLDRAIAARGSGGGMDDAPSDVEEARTRYAAGLLAGVQGDLVAARAHLERSAELWRGLVATTAEGYDARPSLVRALIQLLRTLGLQGDPSVPRRLPEALAVAYALDDRRLNAEVRFGHGRGLLHSGGDVAPARWMLLEAHTSFHDMDDLWHMGNIQVDLGVIALLESDIPGARRGLGEALTAARALKDQALEALACHNLGEVARLTGDDVEAATQYERSLRLYRAMGARAEAPRLVHNRGYLALHAGEPECARARFAKSLALFDALGQRRGMAEAVAGLAAVAAQEGTPEAGLRAAHLWAAADAAHRAGGTHAWPVDQAERDRYEPAARAAAGARAFDAAYDASRSAPLDDIVSETLRTPSLP